MKGFDEVTGAAQREPGDPKSNRNDLRAKNIGLRRRAQAGVVFIGLFGWTVVRADVNIGVILSTTGPVASLGIPEESAVALLPKEAGSQKINYIVLNDSSDTTVAVTDARKLVAEYKVDAIIGPSTTPGSLAMIDVIAESGTPMISLGGSSTIAQPVDQKKRWVFKVAQDEKLMSATIVSNMASTGVKTVGVIAFNDAYGESWLREFRAIAQQKNVKIVSSEGFARSDTSVTGQVLKVLASRPDAVFIAASGTSAALPQKALREHGYTGKIYQTNGVSNTEFLRIGGKDVEGTLFPAGPVIVAEQLPDDSPVKKSAMTYLRAYEAKYGRGMVSAFPAYTWDAGNLIAHAIPGALKVAQPGTMEFRSALRDSIEHTKDFAGAHGVFNMSPTDHVGLDQRSSVMVTIKNGVWRLAP
jgi:branched-chain amino acid transport system substrate-binding protein